MLINCDLGEELKPDPDPDVMPLIDLANIACGGHAGTPHTVLRTLHLAQTNNTRVGLHPSYADKAHFGRRELALPLSELKIQLEQQIVPLLNAPKAFGMTWFHLKPHGALYARMMREPDCFRLFLTLCQAWMPKIHLVVLAGVNEKRYAAMAQQHGVRLLKEAFADRAYLSNGELAPRSAPNSLYTDPHRILKQAEQLLAENRADTLCFHSDNPASVQALTVWRDPAA